MLDGLIKCYYNVCEVYICEGLKVSAHLIMNCCTDIAMINLSNTFIFFFHLNILFKFFSDGIDEMLERIK